MKDWKSQSHVKWECKYHVVILPKCRKKAIYGKLRRKLGMILQELCRQKGVELEEGKAMPDHIHMLLSVPPKYSIASVMGKLKSQSASKLRKFFPWLTEVYWNENIIWSPGYFVSSVGVDEETIKKYVELQGRQDSGQLQLKLLRIRIPGLPGGIYEVNHQSRTGDDRNAFARV